MPSAAYAALSPRLVLLQPSSIFSMAFLGRSCLLLFNLLLFTRLLPYRVHASDCDLGAADVIFLVKASHLMSREDFDNVKELMKEFSNSLDIGRDNTTTHVGAVFFDNIGPAQTRIALTAYSRVSDLQTAIDGLARLPCGTGWCKEKESSFRPALDYAMSRFPKGRMKKIVIINSGNDDSKLSEDVAELTAKDPWLRVLRIFIKGNVVTAEDPNYNYLQAYHDPYKRYAERMSQLYPNMSVPIPAQPTPIRVPKRVEQGRITVQTSDEVAKMSEEVCQQLFSCPPCGAVPGGRDPFDKETPLQNKLPHNWKHKENQATTKVSGGSTEDYEYEITADPPGMTINTNPAKNKNRRGFATTTPMTSFDYVYEDSVDDSQGMKRSKRAAMSPRQKDCTCVASPSQPPATSFSLDSSASSSSSELGCSGSSATGTTEGCGGSSVPAEAPQSGCGGSSEMIPGSGCPSSPVAQLVQYATAPTYPSYQPNVYPYYQQPYTTPCRVGSPCARRLHRPFFYGYSPCGRTPCSQVQPQFYSAYQQNPNYQQNYAYWYQSQQLLQPQNPQQQQTYVPQPQQGYVTNIPLLPSIDAVHDSDTAKKEEKTEKVFKVDGMEKMEKLEKPDDPFSAKAYGGAQFKKISSGGLLEALFPSNPPPINDLLSKFEPSQQEDDFSATIPARTVTLKPADAGSEFSDVEALAGRRRRVRRTTMRPIF